MSNHYNSKHLCS